MRFMTVNDPGEFLEWGYPFEYEEGARDAVSPLASVPCSSKYADEAREGALGMFRAIAHDDPDAKWVFVTRRVTRTPWTDEETTSA